MSKAISTKGSVLGGISAEQFLSEYWQKKPLLIRQALPGYQCPVDSGDLAGLAMEEEVESRLILNQGENGQWKSRNGPFTEEDFNTLPEENCTFLVQQLDAWVPEINALKQLFQFIPNWRFDDIMASYATNGGSVGPHYDQYDVFIIQGQGTRRWRLGQRCNHLTPQLQDTSLRIIKDFEESENWLLEPGDMIYIPPYIAHYGIAEGESINLSVGYKAPSDTQIISHFTDHILEKIDPNKIYQDPDLTLQENPGEISRQAIDKVQATLKQALENSNQLERWLGEYSTQAKNECCIEPPEVDVTTEELQALIEENTLVYTNEGSRFAYTLDNENSLLFFVDGTTYELVSSHKNLHKTNLEFVQTLCEMGPASINQLLPASTSSQIFNIVLDLLHKGSLYFET